MRFPGFSEDWKKIRLGNISDFISKGTTPKIFTETGVRYIKIESLDGIFINKNKCLFISNENHTGELKRSILKEKDILFAIAGATVGKVGVVSKDDLPANTNQALAIIRLTDKEIINFIIFILDSKVMKRYIHKSISVGAQPNLNLQQINNFDFYSPKSKEQKKIATFLTLIDLRISTQNKIIEDYQLLKKGMMQKFFKQELKFKDENGNDFIELKTIQLSNLGFTLNGLTGKTKDDFGTGKPYIQYKQIFDSSKIQIENCGLVSIKENDNQTKVQYGDVFFTTSSETPNEIGTASVLLDKIDEMYLNSFCFGFRANQEKLLPQFAQYFFRSEQFRRKMIPLAQGSTRYNISKNSFLKLKIQLPQIKEQQKIANILSTIDAKIALETKLLEQYKSQKKYLLQNLFI